MNNLYTLSKVFFPHFANSTAPFEMCRFTALTVLIINSFSWGSNALVWTAKLAKKKLQVPSLNSLLVWPYCSALLSEWQGPCEVIQVVCSAQAKSSGMAAITSLDVWREWCQPPSSGSEPGTDRGTKGRGAASPTVKITYSWLAPLQCYSISEPTEWAIHAFSL